MIWIACAAVAVIAAFFVLVPLLSEPKASVDIELLAETELDRLLARKAVIYHNLKDLDFEHSMGRLSEEDYYRLEADYKNDAALLLQKLDQLGASEGLDEAIEKEIAARKAKLYAPASVQTKETLRCPSCGAELVRGKKFCADCGKKL